MCPDGVGRVGCGPQETFRACADFSIKQGSQYQFQPPRVSHVGTAVPAVPGYHLLPVVSGFLAPQVPSAVKVSIPQPLPIFSCAPVGPYIKVPGMADWCNLNCRHDPAHCPASHCRCVWQRFSHVLSWLSYLFTLLNQYWSCDTYYELKIFEDDIPHNISRIFK